MHPSPYPTPAWAALARLGGRGCVLRSHAVPDVCTPCNTTQPISIGSQSVPLGFPPPPDQKLALHARRVGFLRRQRGARASQAPKYNHNYVSNAKVLGTIPITQAFLGIVFEIMLFGNVVPRVLGVRISPSLRLPKMYN